MANSQFTIYQSSDASAPQLNGITGSLLALWDAVLVTGYGTKPGAGWAKPFANSASVGAYQLSTGSCGLYYYLLDNGPGVGVGKEGRLTGWDIITSVFNGIVTGSNQWPTATQLAIGNGAVVVRKSAAASAVTRNWIIFADSRSCYTYIATGDTAGVYSGIMMGELYSYKTSGLDNYRAMIIGRSTEDSSTTNYERLDNITLYGTVTPGHFISRNFSGYGSGMTCGKGGDYRKGNSTGYLNGVVPFPNPCDGAIYLARCPIHDNLNYTTRGHLRGFWHFCHPIASVSDLQQFSGSGALAGRIFMIVKQSGYGGLYCMETSNTVETN
jgi:hypothetical protein